MTSCSLCRKSARLSVRNFLAESLLAKLTKMQPYFDAIKDVDESALPIIAAYAKTICDSQRNERKVKDMEVILESVRDVIDVLRTDVERYRPGSIWANAQAEAELKRQKEIEEEARKRKREMEEEEERKRLKLEEDQRIAAQKEAKYAAWRTAHQDWLDNVCRFYKKGFCYNSNKPKRCKHGLHDPEPVFKE